MQIKSYPIGQLSNFDDNPRIIDTYKFQTLVNSIKDFPEMMQARPLIIDEDYKILCGNMRYRACVELGYTEILAKMVNLPEEKKQELIIKDNLVFGDWDDAAISKDWDKNLFDKWLGFEEINFDLYYKDPDGKIGKNLTGVKKTISFEFGIDLDEAREVIKKCKKENIYIGGVFIETFKTFKI